MAISATVGALTSGTIARVGAANVTATNVLTALGAGKGLRIGCTVADLTTCASGVDYCIFYTVTSP